MMGTRWPKEEYEQYEPKELRQQASGSKAPPTYQRPFKEGSHLTCRHGRFWRSCQRCRLEK
jgi:hypothetical protein